MTDAGPVNDAKREQARSKATTLRDVARAAGVSTASASRALARPDSVGVELRGRIMAAVERLHYVPNAAARALASRRSGLVGAFVTGLEGVGRAPALEALAQALAAAGYSLAVAVAKRDSGDTGLDSVRRLLAHGAEALVLTGIVPSAALDGLLAASEVPWVWLDRSSLPAPHVCLGPDPRRAMRVAAGYMRELGHARIGVIASAHSELALAAREELGAARGVQLMEAEAVEAGAGSAARRAMQWLLEQPEPPTAVLCSDDLLAFAAMRECQELGVGVPDRVSIVGFGDSELARQVSPALTSIRLADAEIGARAAAYLLARLQQEDPPAVQEAAMKLVVRESTAVALTD